jgi:hypothetical protein
MLRHHKHNRFKFDARETFKALCLQHMMLELCLITMIIHYIYMYALSQVYTGLQNLLGKPVLLCENNLTWTLLKYVNSENSGVGNVEYDLVAESYTILRVALSVMHECFEPLHKSFARLPVMS